jgi:hypothetical protein
MSALTANESVSRRLEDPILSERSSMMVTETNDMCDEPDTFAESKMRQSMRSEETGPRPCGRPIQVLVIASLTALMFVDAAAARAIDPQSAAANEQVRQDQPERSDLNSSSRDLRARPQDETCRPRPASLDLSPSAIRKAIKSSMDPLDDVYAERTATFGGGRPGG